MSTLLELNPVDSTVRAVSSRFRKLRAAHTASVTCICVSTVCLILFAAQRFAHGSGSSITLLRTVSPVVTIIATAIAWIITRGRPSSSIATALYIDQMLGFGEELSTAVSLRRDGQSQPLIIQFQAARANGRATGVDLRHLDPPAPAFQMLLATCLLAALLAVCVLAGRLNGFPRIAPGEGGARLDNSAISPAATRPIVTMVSPPSARKYTQLPAQKAVHTSKTPAVDNAEHQPVAPSAPLNTNTRASTGVGRASNDKLLHSPRHHGPSSPAGAATALSRTSKKKPVSKTTGSGTSAIANTPSPAPKPSHPPRSSTGSHPEDPTHGSGKNDQNAAVETNSGSQPRPASGQQRETGQRNSAGQAGRGSGKGGAPGSSKLGRQFGPAPVIGRPRLFYASPAKSSTGSASMSLPITSHGGRHGTKPLAPSAPKSSGLSRIAYARAAVQYKQQLENQGSYESIPAAYKQEIRRYFDSLAPRKLK